MRAHLGAPIEFHEEPTILRFELALPSIVAAIAFACASSGYAQTASSSPADMQPFTAKPVADPKDSFRFAILSDRTGGARTGVFERAIEQINLLKPEFVLSVGDLVEGYAIDPAVLARQWQEFEALIARLDARFYRVAGNHDLSNAVMLANWRKQFRNTYYSFVYKDVLFLVSVTMDDNGPHVANIRVDGVFGPQGPTEMPAKASSVSGNAAH